MVRVAWEIMSQRVFSRKLVANLNLGRVSPWLDTGRSLAAMAHELQRIEMNDFVKTVDFPTKTEWDWKTTGFYMVWSPLTLQSGKYNLLMSAKLRASANTPLFSSHWSMPVWHESERISANFWAVSMTLLSWKQEMFCNLWCFEWKTWKEFGT